MWWEPRARQYRSFISPKLPFIEIKTGAILNDKIELQKRARELVRWMILRMLYAGRPGRVSELIILRVLKSLDFDCKLDDVRQDMDYMRSVGLAEAGQDNLRGWWARLTALGIAVVEYGARTPSGIGHPEDDAVPKVAYG